MFKYSSKLFKSYIASRNSNIYFYAQINQYNICKLMEQITYANEEKSIREINLHIKSVGGDLECGLLGYDLLKQSTKPINTFCEGNVASSATLLYLAGNTRYITKHSTLLIHQLSGHCRGTYTEMNDDHTNSTIFMTMMNNIYTDETIIDSKTLKFYMNRNLFITSEECIKYGFSHKIL